MAIETVSEKAKRIVEWLDFQNESLSFGLRSVADAEKLYDHWQANSAVLPEFADCRDDEDEQIVSAARRAALGYDPLDTGAGRLVRTLKKGGKTYVVTFDNDRVVDTVVCGGTALSTKNRVVQQILRSASIIAAGMTAPKGFEWVRS